MYIKLFHVYHKTIPVSGIKLANHPNVTKGLLSPIMLGTLFELPSSITKYLIGPVYKALSIALIKMHTLKIIHCDIKPQNIFRDGLGFYHLADYDACVDLWSCISLSTRCFWPVDLQSFENTMGALLATEALDYTMLAATLFYLADKWNIIEGKQMSINEMFATAEEMMRNNDCGAADILDCIKKVDMNLLFAKAPLR